MLLTGAQIIIECLKEQGVDVVFGYPGGQILTFYDALYTDGTIRHILTAHEQGACHAADGYSRSTGRTGVVIATSGPGATNLVTGLATAYMDSTPLIAITGNVPTALLGRDSFQEVDIVGITMPITKHNYQLRSVEKVAQVVREAFAVAKAGRPGPVLIDVPKDVQQAKCDYTPMQKSQVEAPVMPRQERLEEALRLIACCKRPFIYAGGGVVKARATKQLVELAGRISAPVACSLMGLGAIPGSHPLFTGMIGMHGTKASNMGVTNSDLLIVLGARFSDRVIGRAEGFAPGAQILHVDIDPAEVNKNIRAHHGIIGDIAAVLDALLKRVEKSEKPEWLAQVAQWKAEAPLSYAPDGLHPQYVIEQLSALADDRALVCTDVGQHQMWTGQFYRFRTSGTFITSGGLGTMGFGLGAAIGAKVANPDRPVMLVTGDGSFRMNLNEMTTVARYNLPIVILLMNNHVLGMVRQWQTLFFDKRYSQTNLTEDIDFGKIASGFGIPSWRVTGREEVERALTWALGCGGPALLEFVIDSDEKVLPMVAPGDSIDRLILNVDEVN
jgi:acetolactate synthase I/II/III large subunit